MLRVFTKGALSAGGSLRCVSRRGLSENQFKSHSCGALSLLDVEKRVRLSGWLSSQRTFNKNLKFLSLRDGVGSTQIRVDSETAFVSKGDVDSISVVPLESIITVEGEVVPRPQETINSSLSTGEIEVHAKSIKLLNIAEDLPFPFHQNEASVGDPTKLQYRYLELRQPHLQANLRLRSKITKSARDYFHSRGFVEIETPTLFKSTPEGAREFLVATRNPGKFYSLPQSPQQYKQLLMASGFEKYFQLARCYRDESGRKDRQPEFTQIDVEMAFITQEDIIETIEGLLKQLWGMAGITIDTPFIRMKHADAIRDYGIDKPDLRYGFKINDITQVFQNTQIQIFQNKQVKAIKFTNFGQLSKHELASLREEAAAGGGQVMPIEINQSGQWSSPIKNKLSEKEVADLKEVLQIQNNDLILISSGEGKIPNLTLGRSRPFIAQLMHKRGLLPELNYGNFKFLWVVDFPLFSRADADSVTSEPGGIVSEHHPFTAPHPEDVDLIYSDPEKARAQHYDIVLNGVEIGGGSIRIHDPTMQSHIFKNILKLSPSRFTSFEHLLGALSHGCPPHGGIALGLDRLVAILCQSETLNPVIAFPKTSTGVEPMTGSPSTVDEKQLEEVFLRVLKPKQ